MSDHFELLSIREAAKFLSVTETSLRRWTNAGRLACVRIGAKRERRFQRSDLLAFLEHQPAGSAVSVRTSPRDAADASRKGLSIPHGTHLCALHVGDAGRTESAVDFLSDGLRAGEACHLLATPETTREMIAGLEQRHGALHGEIAAGRLVLAEYLPSGAAQLRALEARFLDATRRGNRALRLVGSVSESLLAAGKRIDDVLRYEAGYDRLLARRFPLVTLCQYDARLHSGSELYEVLRRHPDVFRYPVAPPLDRARAQTPPSFEA
jgi:transcriptional repressor of dcmA and dcmR